MAQVVRLAMDFRHAVQARRGDRHVLLPPPRAQRRGRALVHAAACCTGRSKSARSVRDELSGPAAAAWAKSPATRPTAIAHEQAAEARTRAVGRQQRRLRVRHARIPGVWKGYTRRPRSQTSPTSTPAWTAARLVELLDGSNASCRRTFIRIRRSSGCCEARREMAARRAAARLVGGRGLGFASLADRRLPRAPERPGQHARHVQPAARRAARLSGRPPLHAAAAHCPRTRRRSRSSTARSRKRACWASSMATASIAPTGW